MARLKLRNSIQILLLQKTALELIIDLINDKELRKVEGVFRISGRNATVNKTYNKILSQEKVDFNSFTNIHDKTVLLKRIIRELGEMGSPLIPNSALDQNKYEDKKYKFSNEDYGILLSTLLPIEKALLTSFLFLLNSLSRATETKMTSNNLAIVTSPNMFTPYTGLNLNYLGELIRTQSEIVAQLIDFTTSLEDCSSIIQRLHNVIDLELTNDLVHLRQYIKETRFKVGGFLFYQDRVERCIDGVLIRVPHRVGEILDVLDDVTLTVFSRYAKIQTLAQEAIDSPRSWRFQSTTDFYRKIVNAEFDCFVITQPKADTLDKHS